MSESKHLMCYKFADRKIKYVVFIGYTEFTMQYAMRDVGCKIRLLS